MALSPFPRLVLAGLAGDAGKTLLSIGLARALDRRGVRVAAFKKGPDYIDAAWLGAAAGRPAHHLDTYLMSDAELAAALASAACLAELALIEGNRGLFDGVDVHGTHSTAQLARRIGAPIVLVLDASKATRTLAALVLGCRVLEPDAPLAGVVLNRLGSARHERVAREAIALAGGPPVLGAVPRLDLPQLPSRHLGLLPPGEHADARRAIEAIADAVERSVDLPCIQRVAAAAPPLEIGISSAAVGAGGPRPRIGVLRDAAFCFYYAENLAALEEAGADLVPMSALADTAPADVDALYAGGGFPEEHAERLADNVGFRTALASRIGAGMPVWAECGGLMYLANALRRDGASYPMVGALPVTVEYTARPQGHGYVEARVDATNPFLPQGTRLRGHEFHYSRLSGENAAPATALAVDRGVGIGGGRDGIVVDQVFASYMHLLAPGAPAWAPALVRAARTARGRLTTRS